MSARPMGHSLATSIRSLLVLVVLAAALGAAAAVAVPASAATSEDYFYISSLGPTYATGGYFGEFGAGPNGIATDSAGNLYVTIPRGFVKFWASSGDVACVYTGDNDYTAGSSYGLDVDSSGNVYYADRTNHLIAKLHPDDYGVSGYVYHWVSLTGKDGSGTPLIYGDGGDLNIGTGPGEFNFPSDVAVDGHYLWVADMLNHRIQKFETATGDNSLGFVGQWGKTGNVSGSLDGEFNKPRAIDAQSGTSGHIFVAEELGRRVQEFTKNGAFVSKFGSTAVSDPLYLLSPTGVDVDAQGDVYVTDLDTTTSWVGKFHSVGSVWSRVTRLGNYGVGNAQFSFPWSSVVDPSGYLWVTDTQNNKVKRFARDTTPPEVHATGIWSVWTNDPRHPEFVATDPTVSGQYTSGGVTAFYSYTGGAPWYKYEEPLSTWNEGDNPVTYYATDAVGNASAQTTLHVYFDKTKPVTTPSGVPAGWSKTDVPVTLQVSNDGLSPLAGTQYRLQGDVAWTAYAGPFTVSAQGASTYEYRSYDAAQNYESVKTLSVSIDKTTPVTTVSGVTDSWNPSNVAVTLTPSSDGLSPVVTAYRVEGASTWTPYTGPFSVTTEGTTVYEYRSTDGAGNVEGTRTVTVRIDRTAPATTASGVTTRWSKIPVLVTLTPGEDGAAPVTSTEYRAQGAPTWTTYTGPFSVTTQGASVYEYRSTDGAGNMEAAKTIAVRIDGRAPVPKALANRSVKRNAPVKLPFRIADVPGAQANVTIRIYKGSALKKTLKGGTRAANASLTLACKCRLPKGKYTWKVYATDLAGNAQVKPGVKTLTVK
jgi:hypothetical protein